MNFGSEDGGLFTPTRTLRRMVPGYIEQLQSPLNIQNRPRRKRVVDQALISTSRGFAGKRSSTPSYIRASEVWPGEPDEPRSCTRQAFGFVMAPPETRRMVFSAVYKPQIRVKIKYDTTEQSPRKATYHRIRKPVPESVPSRSCMRGSLVLHSEPSNISRKHATYGMKPRDPQTSSTYRRITREHPVLSVRMRGGEVMKDLISSQWNFLVRAKTE